MQKLYISCSTTKEEYTKIYNSKNAINKINIDRRKDYERKEAMVCSAHRIPLGKTTEYSRMVCYFGGYNPICSNFCYLF